MFGASIQEILEFQNDIQARREKQQEEAKKAEQKAPAKTKKEDKK